MEAKFIYLFSLLLLGILAILSFWQMRKGKYNYQVRMKKNRYDKVIDYVKQRIDEKELGYMFSQSNIKLSGFGYQLIRYIVVIIWLVLLHVIYQLKGGSYPIADLLLIIFIFWATSPTPFILGKRTPFKIVMDLLIRNFKYKKNVEIYRAITQLKNIALTKKNKPIGADFILEQIKNFSNTIRPVFNRMLALWTMGRKEEACNYFGKAIDTREAEAVANIFRKIDDLKPNELLNQIILLQEQIRKERETKKLEANENKGNLIYLLVIMSSSIIMVNFIVVVYFLDTLQQLKFIQ